MVGRRSRHGDVIVNCGKYVELSDHHIVLVHEDSADHIDQAATLCRRNLRSGFGYGNTRVSCERAKSRHIMRIPGLIKAKKAPSVQIHRRVDN